MSFFIIQAIVSVLPQKVKGVLLVWHKYGLVCHAMIIHHPYHEGVPTETQLKSLLDLTFDWVSAHGRITPISALEGHAPDGLPIAGESPHYAAQLPVRTLRTLVPEAMGSLGVGRFFEVRGYEPFHPYDPNLMPDVQFHMPQSVKFLTGHPRRSPLMTTTYQVELPDSPGESYFTYVSQRRKPNESGDEIASLARGMAFSDMLTLSQYRALKTIMTVWTERWREVSPGRPRRFRFK
jgi:hypothetical protein